ARMPPITPAHFPPPETPTDAIGQRRDPGQALWMWSSRDEIIAQRQGGGSCGGFPRGPSAAITSQPRRNAMVVNAGMGRMLEPLPSLVPLISRMGVGISGSKSGGMAIATRARLTIGF